MRVLLLSLNGKPAPDGLGESLCGIEELSQKTRDNFGELLIPNLESMPEDQLDSRVARLCRRNDLDLAVAGSSIKAAAYLFQNAAACALEPEDLAKDIEALGGTRHLIELLLPLYNEVLPDLRRHIAQATLGSHGAVLTGIEWRVDTLGASNRGRKINLPVALMTFRYQEGGETRSATYQLLPDMVGELRDVCDRLLTQRPDSESSPGGQSRE